MEFDLTLNNTVFRFELDDCGQVWYLEYNADLEILKNGINHDVTHDLERAKEIAVEILYSKGLLD